MNTKVVNINNFKLHLINNNNFKTTRIEARLILDMDKKEVPLLELLSNALIYTTKEYNTRKDFINHCKDLYDTFISTQIKEDGNRLSLNIGLSFLDNKYSCDTLLEDEIKLLYEILYNPNISNGKFDEDTFDAVVVNIKSSLESMKEDKSRYAKMRLVEILNEDNDNFISQLSEEYYNKIVNTTKEELVDFYNKIINNLSLNIVVLGNIDVNETEKIFKNVFNKVNGKTYNIDPIIEYKQNKKIDTRFESDKSSQSKLYIACNVENNLTKYEKEVVMQIYNIILGGFADSLFFKNIREKHSICYYISSNFSYYENVLYIRSGITKDNYDKIIELIKKEMKKMVKGDFSNDLLEEAKSTYKSMLITAMDYPANLVNNYYDNQIDNISLFKDRMDDIDKVSIEDIKKVASKVKMNTIFLFGGDSK